MKKYFLLLICCLLSTGIYAQDAPQEIDMYQIYLDQPANSIDKLTYDTDGEPIEGELSKDGRKIIMTNYRGKSRVKVNVTYKNGQVDEFIRSSCYIDPIAPL